MASEVYQFYQENKINFPTQSDIIKGFLEDKLHISLENLSLEAEAILKKEVVQLVSKLKKILGNVKNMKNKQHLNKAVFMTCDQCELISKLDVTFSLGDAASSEETDKEDPDAEDDKFKHFFETLEF